MLTPYGSNFKEGWSFTWSIDVTDFQTFLRDSVEIEYIHSGYESPDLGWDLTLDFDILFGPQVADFVSVEKAGKRTFAGFKLEPRAIVHGPDETLPSVDFDKSKKYGENEKVIVEIMEIQYDEERTFEGAGKQ